MASSPPAARPPPPPKKLPFELREGERYVAHSPAASIHRLGASMGRIWLTSQRVLFRPVVPLGFWLIPPFALALLLVNRWQRRELPLTQIGTAERTTFGRNRNVLLLGTTDLTRDLKVVVDDFDAFTAALSAQRAKARPST
jgi:hypothetical protein